MQLRYGTLRRVKEAEVWIDTRTAQDIAKNLRILLTQAKNGITLDSDEQIIYDAIKDHIESQPEKELNKRIGILETKVENLEEINRILREKNKQLITQSI